ncbi:MAG: autotransporter domain-containing protein [Burkholderiales bacterium]|nr:autotransporter domain-containing protein [Burkholderiales bacterium]
MRRHLLLLVHLLVMLMFSFQASAECGGNTNCIGVGASEQEAAVAHHGLGPATFTLGFGNQVIATTSSAKTIYVAAVTGPAATQATLGDITITGADASQFSISGGSCLTMGPIQGGADCTILVSFNPATAGTKTATVHVPLNPPCAGCITERTVTATGVGTLAPPVAQATVLSVQANTPTTLDLTPFISGAELAGIRISAAPSKGSATIQSNIVTYTPAAGYLGTDTFSYETFSSTETSAPAVVTVSVVARPTPATEPHVVSLITSQAMTAHQFGMTQISNISRRLESLHRVSSKSDQSRSFGISPRWQKIRQLSTPAASRGQPALVYPDYGMVDPDQLRQSEPSGASDATAAEVDTLYGPGRTQGTSAARLLANLATTGSIPVLYQSESRSGNTQTPAGGFWTDGMVSFGKQDASPTSSGMRFATSGLTAGYDTRLNDDWIVGMGIGYARAGVSLGSDGSNGKNEGRSVAVYGSYQPVPDFFVDSLLGYGALESRSERYVARVGSFGRSNRDGDQVFGSIGGRVQFQERNLLLSPYGRLEFSDGKLHKATETGAGLSSLTYFEQKLTSFRIALGIRAQSFHETEFGLALPHIRAEYGHELSKDGDATIAYADMETGPTYTVVPAVADRNSLLLGVGSEFLTTHGLIFGFDFSATRRASDYNDHTMRVWLSANLDGNPKLDGLFSSHSRNPIALEAGFRWDDNVSRTGGASTKLSDGTYFLGSGISTTVFSSGNTRLKLTGALDVDKFERYEALDAVSLGIGTELQYRNDGRFETPTWGVFARANWDDTGSRMRRGHRSSAGVNVRAPVTDRIQLFGVLARNNRFASNTLFDTRDVSAKLSADYQFSQRGTLYLGGELRRGDAVSAGLPLADTAAIAKVVVADDAFARDGLMGYRYAARTTIWTVGYNLRLGNRDSLDFSWRQARVSPTQTPDYTGLVGYPGLGAPGTGGGSNYTAQQFTLAYLMRF